MDSTLRSNISVGLPLDLLVYECDALAVTRFVSIDEKNQYFRMIRDTWGEQLKRIFESIDDPVWNAPAQAAEPVLSKAGSHAHPVRIPVPKDVDSGVQQSLPLQSVAEQGESRKQH
jgi:putative proteasome-type protease